ncbi:MAG TPA: outer membrane protein transport protein [Nevskiaceae bacterium]|nr:outer membrane protein transport protein [Nevskiaceae bacterium]
MIRPNRLAPLALLLSSAFAHAGNGLNDFGFGPTSQSMGGADLALSRDTAALNLNPAGLTQIRHRAFDVNVEPFGFIDVGHRDSLGNDTHADNPLGISMNGGLAWRISPELVAGFGFFGQGGAGFVYEDLRTGFGNRDEAESLFGSFKFAPGLAWQVSDRLSIGAALGIVWSSARQKFFYDTSDPASGFGGFRLDSVKGWSAGGKYGFQYRPAPGWVIGAAYTDEIPIDLHGGEFRQNFEADPAIGSRVRYREASAKGLNIASETGVGVAWQATPRLLLATEINWIDWSHAMKKSTISASRPTTPGAPPTLRLEQNLDWRDQWVTSIGAEWRLDPKSRLRGGFNYGRNPVPKETLSPLLNLIGTTSFSVGYARDLSAHWTLNSCLLIQLDKEVSYDNPQSPFGPSREEWYAWILQVGLSRRW